MCSTFMSGNSQIESTRNQSYMFFETWWSNEIPLLTLASGDFTLLRNCHVMCKFSGLSCTVG